MNSRTFVGLLGLLTATALAAPVRAQVGEPELPVVLLKGRQVNFDLGGVKHEGELLAVSRDTLWLGATELRPFLLSDLGEVSIREHGFGWKQGLAWTAIGALVTSVGLGQACSTVEDGGESCGAVAASTALAWLVVGGFATRSIAKSSHTQVPPNVDLLRRFARFPQGLPPGFEAGPRAAGTEAANRR